MKACDESNTFCSLLFFPTPDLEWNTTKPRPTALNKRAGVNGKVREQMHSGEIQSQAKSWI